jgi:hypothetical protein
MFELARMCRNAAYTISELQNDTDLLRAMLSQKRTEKRCYVAENAKLRESVKRLMTQRDERLARAETDNAKLRELVRDMWHDGMCECDERGACAECEYHFPDRMCELGVEVDG